MLGYSSYNHPSIWQPEVDLKRWLLDLKWVHPTKYLSWNDVKWISSTFLYPDSESTTDESRNNITRTPV
jgi:hypothetical protein